MFEMMSEFGLDTCEKTRGTSTGSPGCSQVNDLGRKNHVWNTKRKPPHTLQSALCIFLNGPLRSLMSCDGPRDLYRDVFGRVCLRGGELA